MALCREGHGWPRAAFGQRMALCRGGVGNSVRPEMVAGEKDEKCINPLSPTLPLRGRGHLHQGFEAEYSLLLGEGAIPGKVAVEWAKHSLPIEPPGRMPDGMPPLWVRS